MNKAVFEYNWFFRRKDGWLYGYTYKPALSSNQNMFFPEVEARPVPGDKGVLIKEKDNELSFISKNYLIHISELMKTEETNK